MGPAIRIGSVALGDAPRIVAAGGEAEVDHLLRADGAHLVELRADLFAAPTPDRVADALARLRAGARPIVLTVRAAAEGGRAMPDDRRRAIYEVGLPLADALDVELASADLVAALAPRVRHAGKTLVLSAHDVRGTPSEEALAGWIAEAAALGADVTKLATHAPDLAALRRLLGVTLAHRDRGLATMAMGPFGPLSRIALFAAGSLLTYASVGVPTAPGQLETAELAALVRRFYPRPG